MAGAGGSPTGNTGEVIWVVEYTDAPGGPLAKIVGVIRGSIQGLEIHFASLVLFPQGRSDCWVYFFRSRLQFVGCLRGGLILILLSYFTFLLETIFLGVK